MRPYEPLNMTTRKWMEIKPTIIDVDILIPSQKHLYDDIRKKIKFNCGDPLIHVVLYNGTYYISDGHHRVDSFKKIGCKKILCRLLIK